MDADRRRPGERFGGGCTRDSGARVAGNWPRFGLGRLCPYCAVVWAVTIALFWYVTLHNLGRSQPSAWASHRSGPKTS